MFVHWSHFGVSFAKNSFANLIHMRIDCLDWRFPLRKHLHSPWPHVIDTITLKTLQISKSLFQTNYIECNRVFCTSIDHNGRASLLKMPFSPCNYCLIHRVFLYFQFQNKQRDFGARASLTFMRIILYCFYFVSRCNYNNWLKFDAQNGCTSARD